MKKFLIAGLLFASATAINAQPLPPSHDVPLHRDVDAYDRRTDEGVRRADQAYNEGRWIDLSDNVFTASSRQAVPLREEGWFRRLRIEATRGAPVIHRIEIRFRDGTRENFDVERRLDHKQRETVTVDLRGHRAPIDRLVVITDPDNISAYSVFGET